MNYKKKSIAILILLIAIGSVIAEDYYQTLGLKKNANED